MAARDFARLSAGRAAPLVSELVCHVPLLAAVVPVPLWLSGFALLIPSLLENAIRALVALGVSCSVIYNGCRASARLRRT